jgi:hypothetical protein
MGLPESPDYTPEKTILIWDISFDLYRWSEGIDAFLEETSLRTVDCPEAYQTYGDVVDYLWGVLGVQNCYNAYARSIWSTSTPLILWKPRWWLASCESDGKY